MKVFFSPKTIDLIREKYVYLDNDFLSENYRNAYLFNLIKKRFDSASLLNENILLLSKLYKHSNKNVHTSSDLADLQLASLLMLASNRFMLITANKRHFSSTNFDVIAVITVEQDGDDSMRSYSIIQFNYEKFEKCYKELSENRDIRHHEK